MSTKGLRLPDFLIGGAPRSGTTWLCRLLERHPDVFMAKPFVPEPKFFLRPEIYGRGLEYYSQTWFGACPESCRAAGEKTSYYLESADAAARIRECLPGVKLIFIFRNPVDRAYSNYLVSRANGFESMSFADALQCESERERRYPDALRFVRPNAYFARGLYADLLRPYLAAFGRDRLLCLRFEDVRTDPGAVAARVHRFLGVESRPGDGDLGRVNAAERKPDDAVPAGVVRQLAERYAEPNERLCRMLGPDFGGWDAPDAVSDRTRSET